MIRFAPLSGTAMENLIYVFTLAEGKYIELVLSQARNCVDIDRDYRSFPKSDKTLKFIISVDLILLTYRNKYDSFSHELHCHRNRSMVKPESRFRRTFGDH